MASRSLGRGGQSSFRRYADDFHSHPWLLPLVCLGIAAALGVSAPSYMGWVVAQGHAIRVADVAADYTVGLAWALLLTIGLVLWPMPSVDRRALLVAWAAKVAVALGFMLVYEGHYGATLDSLGYFAHGGDYGWQGFTLGEGTTNMIQLVWLHDRFVPRSYHAIKMSFAMLGLVAFYVFYRAGSRVFGRNPRMLLALALFPSLLFWSSILGKEPIVLFGLALVTWGLIAWQREGSLRPVAFIVLGLALLAFMRPWLVFLALVPMLVFPFQRARSRSPALRTAWRVAAVAAVGTAVLVMVPAMGVLGGEDFLWRLNAVSRGWAYGGSALTPPEFNNVADVVTFLPLGAFTALFRPLPGEITSPLLFGLLAGLENLLLLGLVGYAAWRGDRARIREPMALWTVGFLVGWSVVYAFLSYQNLGTATRFKVQVLPLLLGLVYYLLQRPPASRVSTAEAGGVPSARAPAAAGQE